MGVDSRMSARALREIYLRGFLKGIEDIIGVRIREKGLKLICEFAPDLPDAVFVDEQRLRQILLNLLGNAVKFTKQGQVIFRVKRSVPPELSNGAAPRHHLFQDRVETSRSVDEHQFLVNPADGRKASEPKPEQVPGFAVENGEYKIGLRSISAPVFTGGGALKYVVSVLGMFRSVHSDEFAHAERAVVAAGQMLSAALGYPGK